MKTVKVDGEKVGRMLSQRNLKALHDVREDVEELNREERLTRGGKAICERCIRNLDMILKAGHGPEENDKPKTKPPKVVNASEAMAVFIEKSTIEEREYFRKALVALTEIDRKTVRTKQFKQLISH